MIYSTMFLIVSPPLLPRAPPTPSFSEAIKPTEAPVQTLNHNAQKCAIPGQQRLHITLSLDSIKQNTLAIHHTTSLSSMQSFFVVSQMTASGFFLINREFFLAPVAIVLACSKGVQGLGSVNHVETILFFCSVYVLYQYN